jgi:response regulator RpfG family c-di-GMP phosphodiesterase
MITETKPLETKPSILFVDDEENNLNSFKAAFRRDFEIHIANSPANGRKILLEKVIDVIITDQRMPGETGVEFLESIIPLYPESMRILLTGYADIQAVIDAVNKGKIYHYVAKPWDENQLRSLINNATEIYRLRQKNNKLTQDLVKVNDQLEFLLRQNLLS